MCGYTILPFITSPKLKNWTESARKPKEKKKNEARNKRIFGRYKISGTDRALQLHPYKMPCTIHRFTYSLAQHVPYYWAGLAPRADDLEMNYSSYPHGIQVDIRSVIFLPLICPLQLLLPALHSDFTSTVPERDLHRSCHIEKPARCHFSLSFPS
jgi:hypothetical protein